MVINMKNFKGDWGNTLCLSYCFSPTDSRERHRCIEVENYHLLLIMPQPQFLISINSPTSHVTEVLEASFPGTLKFGHQDLSLCRYVNYKPVLGEGLLCLCVEAGEPISALTCP